MLSNRNEAETKKSETMAAEKIDTATLIETVKKHIANCKQDGVSRVKITFGGDPTDMNEIGFGMRLFKIEKADVKQVHAAVKTAGGTPWDYYDEIEFTI